MPRHGSNNLSKHNKPTARDSMELEAAKGQAALAVIIPGTHVKVGLVKVDGAERRGFLITVPTFMDQLTVEKGLGDIHDKLLAKVRPWLGGKPRKIIALDKPIR